MKGAGVSPQVHEAVAGEVDAMLEVLDGGFPPVHEMTGPEARALVAARVQPVDNLDDADAVDHEIPGPGGPIRVRVYHPRGAVGGARAGVVFCHGGGFVLCSIESHDGFCRRLARHADAVVVSVDYRLAPEHPAPAAAEDAYAALAWVAAHAADLGVDPARILTAGDSAGGNLAAVTCLMTRDRGGPSVAGQVLLYPVIEPDFESKGYREFGEGHFNTRAAMEWYWRLYLGATDVPADAAYPPEHVAPLRAPSLAGLPPAVVVTAGRDPLHSEGRTYVAALRDAGVPVRHRHYPELFHGFATIGPFGPAQAARELLWSDIAATIERSGA
jgi:acetyl esterase